MTVTQSSGSSPNPHLSCHSEKHATGVASLLPLVGGSSVVTLNAGAEVAERLWPLIWLFAERGGTSDLFFEYVFRCNYISNPLLLRVISRPFLTDCLWLLLKLQSWRLTISQRCTSSNWRR